MGHWGTGVARRHATTRDQEMDAPIPQTAVCNCGATAILAAGRLPSDWRIVDGSATCGDCLTGSNIVVDLASVREVLRAKEAQPIGGLAIEAPHHGCRLTHEIVCGFAALEFRAGTAAPEGRDEAVPFMLDEAGLDELIIHFSTIRAELVASKTPGAAAREGTPSCAPRSFQGPGPKSRAAGTTCEKEA